MASWCEHDQDACIACGQCDQVKDIVDWLDFKARFEAHCEDARRLREGLARLDVLMRFLHRNRQLVNEAPLWTT